MKETSLVILLSLTCAVLAITSCAERGDDPVLATAGDSKLTKSGLETLAGVPLDSLTLSDQWRLVGSWVERTLVAEEGKRQKLDKDPQILRKMTAVQGEIFRAELLSRIPSPVPTDSMIMAYYASHQGEFLRPKDAYLIELYWAEDNGTLVQFRGQLARGDTSQITEGRVSSEGRWLAEKTELDSDLEKEVSSMQPGEITFPRQYDDGYRVARLIERFPAGTVLDLDAVHDEVAARLVIEQSRARQDSLETYLRRHYPVKILLPDSGR